MFFHHSPQGSLKCIHADDQMIPCYINSLRPVDMCQQTVSSLAQIIMACHLFDAKSLPEPVLTCKTNPYERLKTYAKH